MDFLPIFTKMIELFAIIIIGFIANKFGILKQSSKQALTKIVLNITLPCTILSSVMNSNNLPSLDKIGFLLLIAFLTYVLYFVIAKLTTFLFRIKGEKKGIIEFALIFSNVGFIGYPVTEAIFGADAIFYTCVFNIPFNVLCYSIGVALINPNRDKKTDNTNSWQDKKSLYLKKIKSLLTPAFVASVMALIMAAFTATGPKILGNVTEMVGAMTTPSALMIIGSTLADMPLKSTFTDIKAYAVSLVSVIITPLIAYFVFLPMCSNDAMLLGEAVVISGMPVATSGTMLCVDYGVDEKFMAQLTFITTVLSVVSIPLIATVV